MNAQFVNYGTKDGLSFKSIDHLAEDDEGLIYAGTNEGLDVFDGNQFISIKPNGSEVTANNIVSILFLKKGYLLVSILNKGLFLYNKYEETLNELKLKDHNSATFSATALALDHKGLVWIGSSNGTVFTVLSDHLTSKSDNISEIELEEITQIPSKINQIYAFDDHILIASNSPGLIHIINKNEKIILLPPIYFENTTRIHRVNHVNNILFIGTDNGLYKIDDFSTFHTNNNHVKPWLLNQKIIRTISVHDDILWIGTEGNGLFKLSLEGDIHDNFVYSENKRNSINSNYILHTFVDRSNHLWIGTWFGGLNMLDLNKSNITFIYDIQNENNLFSNILWSLSKTPKDEIYVGTHGNGLAIYDRLAENFKSVLKTESIKSISSLYFDTVSNLLFIGTWGNGVWAYDINNKQLIKNKYDFKLLEADRIYAITRGPRGYLWIGSYNNGLFLFSEKEKKLKPIILSNNSSKKVDIRCLYSDNANNKLFVGSLQNGIFELSIGKSGEIVNKKHYKYFENPDEKINAENMFMANDGKLWLQCRNGLGIISNDKKPYQISQLKEQVITSLCEDKQGIFWVSTYQGIFKINPKSMRSELIVKGHSFYDLLYLEKENLVLAASDDGLVKIDPEMSPLQMPISNILLQNLKVLDQNVRPNKPIRNEVILNKRLNYSDTIVLPHFTQTFSFDIVNVSYNKNQQGKIRYRLKSFDEFWNETNNKSANVSYTNLPYGSYVFQAQTSNEIKVWNSTVRELTIIKQRPWWLNIWAKLLYFLILTTSIYIIYKLIKERIRIKQELKIEKIKHEQENNLYQQKISFFTNISHDIRTPLTLIIGPIEEILSNRQIENNVFLKLQRVLKNSRMLLNLINQILDFRKVETDNLNLDKKQITLNNFIQNIYYQFNELAHSKAIDLELNFRDEEVILIADPVKLESILFNLISNAIKFTPKYGHIIIESFKKEEDIFITIQDSGIGIHPEEVDKVFTRFYTSKLNNFSSGSGIGMALVKKYVDAHDGNIDISSKLNSGTKFTIFFPSLDGSSYEKYINSPDIDLQIAAAISINDKVNQEKKSVILVIDDNPEIINYLEEILKEDYKVLSAGNGKSGFDIANKKIPDLIISDVMMEELNGFELCELLKSNLSTSHIPIILLTAKNSTESKIEGFEKGADAYIEKPFSSRLLLTRIKKIITEREKLKKKFLISNSFTGDSLPSSVDKEFLDNIVSQIEEHISESDFSVQSLIDIVNMSQDQLYRKIKALSGLSINHFIRRVRLNKAAKLIAEGRHTISEVVYIVGFNNPSYFTKCFKAEFGMSPSEYISEKERVVNKNK
ncbi:two-component regulator propeller domain-containing protein [Snuella lapsa]|uniref:histidine kinase n=1 Tax=Snuella lapsa TaxID=870481 RepID=A0ABP6WQY7_9FLAO